MNESAFILKCVRKPTKSRLEIEIYIQIQPLSRIKTLNGPKVRKISPVGRQEKRSMEERICRRAKS